MISRRSIPCRVIAGLVLLPVLIISGCATGRRAQPEERGRITVGVTTRGKGGADLTFRVSIEPAGIEGSVKADAGVLTRGGLAPGDHVVRLLEVPARCRVKGGADRTVIISRQRPAAVVRYDVDCS